MYKTPHTAPRAREWTPGAGSIVNRLSTGVCGLLWLALAGGLAMCTAPAAAQEPIHWRFDNRAPIDPRYCAGCRYVTIRGVGPDAYRMTQVSVSPPQRLSMAAEEYVFQFDGRGGVSIPGSKGSTLRSGEAPYKAALESSGAQYCDFSGVLDGEFTVEYHLPGRDVQEVDDAGVVIRQSVGPAILNPRTYYVFRADNEFICGTQDSPRIALRLTRDGGSGKPDFTELIKQQVETQLRKYLDIPPIPEPELPPAPILIKGEFEKTVHFNQRVDVERQKREASIYRIQQEFRRKVEQRNQLIVARQAGLDAYTQQLTRQATLDALGSLLLRNPVYNADEEVMAADLVSTRSNFSRRVMYRVPLEGKQAVAFKKHIEDAAISLRLNVDRDSISLRDTVVSLDGRTYQGVAAGGQLKPDGGEGLSIDLKSMDMQVRSTALPTQMQSPDLVDRQIGKLRYDDGGINDDVRGAVAAMRKAPEDRSRWLFILAVENYDNADPVLFARNSAELVRDAFQRKFGVPVRNTYALIDDKATAGAFQDKLAMMLKNVKPGDTIYFYYSGHGIPDQRSEESYILPRDREVALVSNDEHLRLSRVYSALAESPAGRVYAFVDSCFSGKTDNISNFKGVAPGVFRTTDIGVDARKVVVLTAGKHNQFSNVYAERGHRMFSYFLLKSLAKTRPNSSVTVMSLYEEISVGVREASFAKGDAYLQEPQILGNRNAAF